MHNNRIFLMLLLLMTLVPVVSGCTIPQRAEHDVWQTGWKNDDVTASPQTDL